MKAEERKTLAEAAALAAEASEREAATRKTELEIEELQLKLARARHDHALWAAQDAQQRVYEFSGEVHDRSVQAAIQTIGAWARVSREPVLVRFYSPGGSVIAGLALYDYLLHLRQVGIRIDTVALGWAASMAGVLLQAGETRYIGPSAYILIHEVSTSGLGKLSEMEDELAFAKRLQQRLLEILASRSTLSERQIERRWKRKDWWVDANEAVQLGFADRLWEEV